MHRMNLLVLGPTGVGKSAWINSFANYLTYESLDEAVQAGGTFPIDCWENWVDPENSETVTLYSNRDAKPAHHIVAAGESVTQNPGEYIFRLRDTEILVIDTPGLLDTADVGTSGHSKDDEHISNILKLISNYEKIHAICILLKANETRLTESFQYVLSEIFKRFDKKASNNVIFILTFAALSQMKPDNTLPALQQFVKNKKLQIPLPPEEANTFCFENDVIKYLLQRKHDIPVDDYAKMSAEINWKVSAETTSKIFKYISSLTPVALTNISNFQMISIIRQVAVDSVLCIVADKQNREDVLPILRNLKKKTKFPDVVRHEISAISLTDTTFERKPLGYRNVVCESSKCGRRVNGKLVYPQVCCTACRSPLMFFCPTSMLWGHQCRVCGCNITDHQWRTTITEITVTNQDLANILSTIEDEASAEKAIEKVTENCKDYVAQCEIEVNQILMICEKLNTYVEQNKLMKSTGEEYQILRHFENKLKICKESEEDTKKESERLQEVITTYEEIRSKNLKCDESEVPELFEELKKLPMRGKEFKKAFDAKEMATKDASEKAKSSRINIHLRTKIASTVNDAGKWLYRKLPGVRSPPEEPVDCATSYHEPKG